MSKETLEYHHDLHHKAYVDNGNKLIAGTEWESKSLEDIVRGTYQAGAVAQNGIFNNASPALEPQPVLGSGWRPGEGQEDAGRAGKGAGR
jgi:superoxide dismutase